MVVTHIRMLILTRMPIPIHIHHTLLIRHIHHRNRHQNHLPNHLVNHHPIHLVVVLRKMDFEFLGLNREVEFMSLAHLFKVGRKCHNQVQPHQLMMGLYIRV